MNKTFYREAVVLPSAQVKPQYLLMQESPEPEVKVQPVVAFGGVYRPGESHPYKEWSVLDKNLKFMIHRDQQFKEREQYLRMYSFSSNQCFHFRKYSMNGRSQSQQEEREESLESRERVIREEIFQNSRHFRKPLNYLNYSGC